MAATATNSEFLKKRLHFSALRPIVQALIPELRCCKQVSSWSALALSPACKLPGSYSRTALLTGWRRHFTGVCGCSSRNSRYFTSVYLPTLWPSRTYTMPRERESWKVMGEEGRRGRHGMAPSQRCFIMQHAGVSHPLKELPSLPSLAARQPISSRRWSSEVVVASRTAPLPPSPGPSPTATTATMHLPDDSDGPSASITSRTLIINRPASEQLTTPERALVVLWSHYQPPTWENRAARCHWSAGFLKDLQFPLPLHSLVSSDLSTHTEVAKPCGYQRLVTYLPSSNQSDLRTRTSKAPPRHVASVNLSTLWLQTPLKGGVWRVYLENYSGCSQRVDSDVSARTHPGKCAYFHLNCTVYENNFRYCPEAGPRQLHETPPHTLHVTVRCAVANIVTLTAARHISGGPHDRQISVIVISFSGDITRLMFTAIVHEPLTNCNKPRNCQHYAATHPAPDGTLPNTIELVHHEWLPSFGRHNCQDLVRINGIRILQNDLHSVDIRKSWKDTLVVRDWLASVTWLRGPAGPIPADQQARPADVRRGARQTHPRRSEDKPSQTANILSTSYMVPDCLRRAGGDVGIVRCLGGCGLVQGQVPPLPLLLRWLKQRLLRDWKEWRMGEKRLAGLLQATPQLKATRDVRVCDFTNESKHSENAAYACFTKYNCRQREQWRKEGKRRELQELAENLGDVGEPMGTDNCGEGGRELEVWWSEQQWAKVSVGDGPHRSAGSSRRSNMATATSVILDWPSTSAICEKDAGGVMGEVSSKFSHFLTVSCGKQCPSSIPTRKQSSSGDRSGDQGGHLVLSISQGNAHVSVQPQHSTAQNGGSEVAHQHDGRSYDVSLITEYPQVTAAVLLAKTADTPHQQAGRHEHQCMDISAAISTDTLFSRKEYLNVDLSLSVRNKTGRENRVSLNTDEVKESREMRSGIWRAGRTIVSGSREPWDKEQTARQHALLHAHPPPSNHGRTDHCVPCPGAQSIIVLANEVLAAAVPCDRTHSSCARRLLRSGQTRRAGFHSRRGRSRIVGRGLSWTMALVGGFLWVLPFPQPLHTGAAPCSPVLILIGSQDLAVKRRPRLTLTCILHSLLTVDSCSYEGPLAVNASVEVPISEPPKASQSSYEYRGKRAAHASKLAALANRNTVYQSAASNLLGSLQLIGSSAAVSSVSDKVMDTFTSKEPPCYLVSVYLNTQMLPITDAVLLLRAVEVSGISDSDLGNGRSSQSTQMNESPYRNRRDLANRSSPVGRHNGTVAGRTFTGHCGYNRKRRRHACLVTGTALHAAPEHILPQDESCTVHRHREVQTLVHRPLQRKVRSAFCALPFYKALAETSTNQISHKKDVQNAGYGLFVYSADNKYNECATRTSSTDSGTGRNALLRLPADDEGRGFEGDPTGREGGRDENLERSPEGLRPRAVPTFQWRFISQLRGVLPALCSAGRLQARTSRQDSLPAAHYQSSCCRRLIACPNPFISSVDNYTLSDITGYIHKRNKHSAQRTTWCLRHLVTSMTISDVTAHCSACEYLLVTFKRSAGTNLFEGEGVIGDGKVNSRICLAPASHNKEVWPTSVEQRRNERKVETGDPRENPTTSRIVRQDSHMRRSGSDPARNPNPVRLGGRRVA
ncbi:hypothetical protein PR048_003886 [Dryococelus australis]|uniref:Uncharacterized protein n=1 Tax=Dryococelus australis TaxID=614101 RepID=A0ABQ9IPF5_9NEOP|nr:hypothetical protein PR048_003886 [Dryococelus australis]